MGQAANTGRNATLDQKKRRAAGRANTSSPERAAIKDFQQPVHAKGKTAGAFGKKGAPNRSRTIGQASGGGGGGGLSSPAKASHLTVGRSKRPARKGGA
jgi:hypothetical protein